jgi:hypothetical protein
MQKRPLFNSVDYSRKKAQDENSLLTGKGFVGIMSIFISAGFIYGEFVEYDANTIFAA